MIIKKKNTDDADKDLVEHVRSHGISHQDLVQWMENSDWELRFELKLFNFLIHIAWNINK